MNPVIALLFIALACVPLWAQSYDNRAKRYVLTSTTEARTEADRTHRMALCDYQPSGLYVTRGERFTVTVTGLGGGYGLAAMIGFKPMWGNRNRTQENDLRNGTNTVTAGQDGILSFIFVKRDGYDEDPVTATVSVSGGRAFPLYEHGVTDPERWTADAKRWTGAQFVQLVSGKALVTIPYRDYLGRPIPDIEAMFENIHNVIDWQDDLAGFDDSSPENYRTTNRLHYLVDIYATAKEREDFYMYASDYLIGMQSGNFADLTEKLDTEWGIWHETGHTHQQGSWTWDSIGEISVNIFSLYVQEKFGRPSRLATIEGGEKETTFARARKYIARPDKNYLVSNEDDYNELFTKLVMFHQLRSAFGWDAFRKLHQHFRKQPLGDGRESTDQEMANRFVHAMCLVTRTNLIPFFQKWGLRPDAPTVSKINALRLPLPKTDPTRLF